MTDTVNLIESDGISPTAKSYIYEVLHPLLTTLLTSRLGVCRYFYVRGRMTDTQGVETSVAIPSAIYHDQDTNTGYTVFKTRFS